MAGHMATPTDSDILTLTQWFSPAYPVGGFAYSHGLEWAIESSDVTDAQQTRAWIADVLQFGSGRNDGIFLMAAYKAKDKKELLEVDAKARAFCASSERLSETLLLGTAFCSVTANVWEINMPKLTYPVAVGYAAHCQNLPSGLTCQMFLQSFMANLVACATRLIPLGQTEGQHLIRELTPLCAEVAQQVQDSDLDALGSTAFLCDVASMKHERQYSRIFRT
ncbi:urease accessory protein UreF [Ruegeria arenilitoris]|uniref:urease accessory protein UreF n=1 Tax=Ruegeria arenilitoris TaxID=1173585 RepID=UPI0020C376E7|nr:urease accessory protein UreF [Ruegeria arenilitoris]